LVYYEEFFFSGRFGGFFFSLAIPVFGQIQVQLGPDEISENQAGRFFIVYQYNSLLRFNKSKMFFSLFNRFCILTVTTTATGCIRTFKFSDENASIMSKDTHTG